MLLGPPPLPQEMVRRGSTTLSRYSPSLLLRALDVLAERRAAYKRRREDQRLMRALQAQAGGSLNNDQLAALLKAGAGQTGQDACCRHGGCSSHHH